MKYLKLYENFQIGETVWLIMTEDEQYVYYMNTRVRDGRNGMVAKFLPVGEATISNIKFGAFESKNDADERIDEIIDMDSIINFKYGRTFSLGEDEMNNLKSVKFFMGMVKDEGLNI